MARAGQPFTVRPSVWQGGAFVMWCRVTRRSVLFACSAQRGGVFVISGDFNGSRRSADAHRARHGPRGMLVPSWPHRLWPTGPAFLGGLKDVGSGEPQSGADVAGGEPSPGADVADGELDFLLGLCRYGAMLINNLFDKACHRSIDASCYLHAVFCIRCAVLY
jgi:hypothetical protein